MEMRGCKNVPSSLARRYSLQDDILAMELPRVLIVGAHSPVDRQKSISFVRNRLPHPARQHLEWEGGYAIDFAQDQRAADTRMANDGDFDALVFHRVSPVVDAVSLSTWRRAGVKTVTTGPWLEVEPAFAHVYQEHPGRSVRHDIDLRWWVGRLIAPNVRVSNTTAVKNLKGDIEEWVSLSLLESAHI